MQPVRSTLSLPFHLPASPQNPADTPENSFFGGGLFWTLTIQSCWLNLIGALDNEVISVTCEPLFHVLSLVS